LLNLLLLARRSLSRECKHLSYWVLTCHLALLLVFLFVCRFVCLSAQKVYCGKTADWIRILLGMVRGVGQGMNVLDGGGDHRKGRAVLGVNLGCPIVTTGDYVV